MAPSAESSAASPLSAVESKGSTGSRDRVIVFAARAAGRVEETTAFALRALRHVSTGVVLVHPGPLSPESRERVAEIVDEILETDAEEFSSSDYATAVERARRLWPSAEEFVLTGDSWFGPVGDVTALFTRMSTVEADWWDVLPPASPREAFAGEGFPAVADRPWVLTAVRRRLFESDAWHRWWRSEQPAGGRERAFVDDFAGLDFRHARAFDTAHIHERDPGLFAPEDLLDMGVPFVDRAVFTSYPPFLDRFAIIPSEIAQFMTSAGYPVDVLRSSLARCVPPKALNTNLGLLSVLSDVATDVDGGASQKVAAIVHVSDEGEVHEILRRLEFLPAGADVFVTTTDGVTAARLERTLEAWTATNEHSYELRVTPQSAGRDMADYFVGCRDVIQSDRYDLIVKLHVRRAPLKTINRLRYFRRYQFDNLLSSPGYARNLLALFENEPRLGVVFPPMIHIGYATMGRAWALLEPNARRLTERLGIRVPLDLASPLAPYGGMWVGRPAAFRSMTRYRWTFADYGWKGQRRFGHLAHLQERLVSASAGEAGYYCRTVLNHDHAEISYTALEYKVDQMFSTTRGWPVEQIGLMHRAGYVGYGGTVALLRMYLRLNHPKLAEALRSVYPVALRGHRLVSASRRAASRLRIQRKKRDQEVSG